VSVQRRLFLLVLLLGTLGLVGVPGCSDMTGPECEPRGRACSSNDQCCSDACAPPDFGAYFGRCI